MSLVPIVDGHPLLLVVSNEKTGPFQMQELASAQAVKLIKDKMTRVQHGAALLR